MFLYCEKRLKQKFINICRVIDNIRINRFISLSNDKKHTKYLVLGPGARKNLSVIKLHTWIPFNILSRSGLKKHVFHIYNIAIDKIFIK